jgi:hypothetical protein
VEQIPVKKKPADTRLALQELLRIVRYNADVDSPSEPGNTVNLNLVLEEAATPLQALQELQPRRPD